jgi:hypothetical protein
MLLTAGIAIAMPTETAKISLINSFGYAHTQVHRRNFDEVSAGD